MMSAIKLKIIEFRNLADLTKSIIDEQTIEQAKKIVEDVTKDGDKALLFYADKFSEIDQGQPYVLNKEQMASVAASLTDDQRSLINRIHCRIYTFALKQRESISELSFPIEGGSAGHRIIPVNKAACYAPGGRYPLPSSVLMTVTAAKVAGVRQIWACSPKASDITIAAASIAGADFFLKIGGAQAISAFANGTESVAKVDMIVGPGNKWVTAAKYLVSQFCGIDMLAGPSELLVVADQQADPILVAADLIAQAEHDDDARVVLVCFSAEFVSKVEFEISKQIELLQTKQTAKNSILENGYSVIVESIQQAVEVSDFFAPEHLEIQTQNALEDSRKFTNYGGLFIGSKSAEVFGDYGFGPNHVLPTSGTARFVGGLSVLNFLKVCTWIDIREEHEELINDTIALANLEGLAGHANSALLRKGKANK